MQNVDLIGEINDEIAEAELALVKDEPLSAELRTSIKSSTFRRLAEYCREQKTSDKKRILKGEQE